MNDLDHRKQNCLGYDGSLICVLAFQLTGSVQNSKTTTDYNPSPVCSIVFVQLVATSCTNLDQVQRTCLTSSPEKRRTVPMAFNMWSLEAPSELSMYRSTTFFRYSMLAPSLLLMRFRRPHSLRRLSILRREIGQHRWLSLDELQAFKSFLPRRRIFLLWQRRSSAAPAWRIPLRKPVAGGSRSPHPCGPAPVGK